MTRFSRSKPWRGASAILAVACGLFTAGIANAQTGGTDSLAARDIFRIGSRGVLCSAQSDPLDPAATGMFDRAYGVVCRDAAAEVGALYAIRTLGENAGAAFLDRRTGPLTCAGPVQDTIGALDAVTVIDCERVGDGLPYRFYALERDGVLFVAEGLRGYDSAISLGLQSLVTDRPVDGVVEVAVTEAGDPAAFARTQAGGIDARTAMTEGYQRNNAGNFAEAAAFFGSLVEPGSTGSTDRETAEYLLNVGLQQSNLGNGAAAQSAFAEAADRGALGDPILSRLLRNYRAIAMLNSRNPSGALAVLMSSVAVAAQDETDERLSQGVISDTLSDRINRAAAGGMQVSSLEDGLRPYERAQLLDAQANVLRGAALRLLARPQDSLGALAQAQTSLAAIRGGKVASAAFMRSETLAESALSREALGEFAAADRDFADAYRLVDANYPLSAASLMAKARLAAYRARRGDADAAVALYAEVVAASADTPGSSAALRDLLKPYFALLATRSETDPEAVSQMFAAGQILTRPGLAQTQAVLARELSAGDDEAARLFRESVNRTREVTRAAGEVTGLAAAQPEEGSPEAAALGAARDRLAALRQEQVGLQAQLADYPRYRVLDNRGLTLNDLQAALRPGEAYYELRMLGQEAYAIFVTPQDGRAFRLQATASQLAARVAQLRNSIVRIEDGQFLTDPYNLDLAHQLYMDLFGPVSAQMAGVEHLIYEPDGALLELPPGLLVMDRASVDAYSARASRPNADPYDYTGVAWLARGRDVTTSVSPKAFVDVRAAPASRASRAYIGLGENARPDPLASFLAPQPVASTFDRCAWPLDSWMNPISASELQAAQAFLGADRSALVLGRDFSDTAIAARDDLASYQVVHFATHGLVTAPRPDCPARPALLTSFGQGLSDGLLTFREIYDLRIDADLVILSACDTAGMATIEATREAGVATGGNFALDGLVRAFVGAGARTVVASHWPVPDDFDATQTLILGMIQAPAGTPVGTALRQAETVLMDAPLTSHPYYWAAFAVVGDGERTLNRIP